ncbi:MAG: hypothetical protein AMXMBFR81_01180 [Chthonomonas sp.]
MDPEEEEPVEEDPVAIEVAAFGEFLDESEDDEEIPEKVLEPCSARPWPNCVLYLAGEPWVNPAAEGSGLWPSTGLSMPTNPPFFGLLCDTVYTMPDGLRELVRPWYSREYPAGAVVRVGPNKLYMSKVVNHHWSRNYSMFAEAQWAAALAKKGNAEQAQQCIDYVLSHQMREGKATNRDLMWLGLAEKWIGDSEYMFR